MARAQTHHRGKAAVFQGQVPQHLPPGLHLTVQSPEDFTGRGARGMAAEQEHVDRATSSSGIHWGQGGSPWGPGSVPRGGSSLGKPWTTQRRASLGDSLSDVTPLGLSHLLSKMGILTAFLEGCERTNGTASRAQSTCSGKASPLGDPNKLALRNTVNPSQGEPGAQPGCSWL